jgi:hypothetical protein
MKDVSMHFIGLIDWEPSSLPHVVHIASLYVVVFLLLTNILKHLVALMRANIQVLVISEAINVPELMRMLLEIFRIYDVSVVYSTSTTLSLHNLRYDTFVALEIRKATIHAHTCTTCDE